LKLYFLNHGTQIISAASDGLIKLWNIATNECVSTFDEHDDKIWAFCMNKDEKKFVSGAADGKLCIWKDVTHEAREVEMEKRETILLQ
jgi:U3 small nucleolar RNA-associated protein 13